MACLAGISLENMQIPMLIIKTGFLAIPSKSPCREFYHIRKSQGLYASVFPLQNIYNASTETLQTFNILQLEIFYSAHLAWKQSLSIDNLLCFLSNVSYTLALHIIEVPQ